MAQFTLDDIRDAAEAKYGSMDITLPDGFTVRLLNPLRLSKAKRDALIDSQKAMTTTVTETIPETGETREVEVDSDVDQVETLRANIRLVADTGHGAERLIEHLGDDLALLATTFAKYSEGTQAGEASASQD